MAQALSGQSVDSCISNNNVDFLTSLSTCPSVCPLHSSSFSPYNSPELSWLHLVISSLGFLLYTCYMLALSSLHFSIVKITVRSSQNLISFRNKDPTAFVCTPWASAPHHLCNTWQNSLKYICIPCAQETRTEHSTPDSPSHTEETTGSLCWASCLHPC